MKKRFKKSTVVSLAFLIYVTAMAVYLLPRNEDISDLEKILTVGASYLIVLLLWLVMRKKEKIADARRAEQENEK